MKTLSNKPIKKTVCNNEKGVAIIETMVMSFVFIMLFGFSIGFFGVVQTGIVNAISARAYAFETFRHRSSLYYFRDTGEASGHYYNNNVRLHAVTSEKKNSDKLFATDRSISASKIDSPDITNRTLMDDKISGIAHGNRNQDVLVSPIWIKTMYGICLNSSCGD